MKYELAAIALLPVLITQGLYVRKVTPRLPEPMGARSGLYGSGPSLNLLILGDSAAAGVGVATQKQALSGRLVAELGANLQVSWKLVAQTGHKAKDVLAELTKTQAESFDVVVTSIGVNDITHGTSSSKWIHWQGQIVELLRTKFAARHIILSSVPPMHLFPALPQPLRWYLGSRAKCFNSLLQEFAAGCTACEFAETEFPLEPSYMATDGFHPGEPAYCLWASHVADIIRNRLAATITNQTQ